MTRSANMNSTAYHAAGGASSRSRYDDFPEAVRALIDEAAREIIDTPFFKRAERQRAAYREIWAVLRRGPVREQGLYDSLAATFRARCQAARLARLVPVSAASPPTAETPPEVSDSQTSGGEAVPEAAGAGH